jgi:hypothetical protein
MELKEGCVFHIVDEENPFHGIEREGKFNNVGSDVPALFTS